MSPISCHSPYQNPSSRCAPPADATRASLHSPECPSNVPAPTAPSLPSAPLAVRPLESHQAVHDH
eukprot:CAMPEP_0114110034 /NCGR_PEP_ID=MMETSP0043_2-20121206/1096_1 /TAXON_ID=464988 /ORGANISM="Hemiselmis andersenii, Strain CCMP644" /LENGTH=64 /DNA_ID=CAMNT_0001201955 /DNA_START=37 /DNA_END=231 /DNA_ORIENTATION=-